MTASTSSACFNAVVESVEDDSVIVGVPGNAYRIRLVWAGEDAPVAKA